MIYLIGAIGFLIIGGVLGVGFGFTAGVEYASEFYADLIVKKKKK